MILISSKYYLISQKSLIRNTFQKLEIELIVFLYLEKLFVFQSSIYENMKGYYYYRIVGGLGILPKTPKQTIHHGK